MRLGVSSGSKLIDTLTTFSPSLSDNEALSKLKQARNLASDNLFGGLKVNIPNKLACVFMPTYLPIQVGRCPPISHGRLPRFHSAYLSAVVDSAH